MRATDDVFRHLMREVTDDLTNNLREVLAATLEKELSASLTKSLLESEFYRRISRDMRSGLRRIYKQMSAAQTAATEQGATAPDRAATDKLFHDASEQLSAVLQQTEEAAGTIMNIVEKHLDWQAESADMLEKARSGNLDDADWKRLEEINTALGDDLVTLLTAMSFQDLTGQRIKKVVEAIRQMESTVLELYLSSGLMMKAYEEKPDQDLESLEEETRATVEDLKNKVVVGSELKGPDCASSQGDIDALLAQFGL